MVSITLSPEVVMTPYHSATSDDESNNSIRRAREDIEAETRMAAMVFPFLQLTTSTQCPTSLGPPERGELGRRQAVHPNSDSRARERKLEIRATTGSTNRI